MYEIKLSKTELAHIHTMKKRAKDKRIFRRLQALTLKAKGRPHQEIADTAGVSVDTVTDWLRIYLDKGLDELCRPIDYDRRSSAIDPHIGKVKQLVEERLVSNLAELQSLLRREFHLDLEASWLSRCCKKNAICLTRKHV